MKTYTVGNIEWARQRSGQSYKWHALHNGTHYWLRRMMGPRMRLFWSVEDSHGAVWGDFKTTTAAMQAVEDLHYPKH